MDSNTERLIEVLNRGKDFLESKVTHKIPIKPISKSARILFEALQYYQQQYPSTSELCNTLLDMVAHISIDHIDKKFVPFLLKALKNYLFSLYEDVTIGELLVEYLAETNGCPYHCTCDNTTPICNCGNSETCEGKSNQTEN
jgi:hypothetical protein